MGRKRVAIACQGGGSQCAFVAGALKTLLAPKVQDRFKIVGLSGTSGGALTGVLAWTGLLAQARGNDSNLGDRIVALWKDLSAQTPQEIAVDGASIALLRLTEHGVLPSFATSPSSPQFRFMSWATSLMIGRPEFTDLRAVLTKHVDFDAVPGLVAPDSPVMLVGAGDVLEGTLKIFSSARGEITADSVLASAAIPNLFPAVWADGHAYWDGIFASNPPIISFLQRPYIGEAPRPEEIWVIQVNRSKHREVPEYPSDITDRRNHLAGNLSLQHELQVIDMVNTILREGALTESFRARFGLDLDQPIAVRFIRMSDALMENLDYASKLSRRPDHINRLIAEGESQAEIFLAELLASGGAEHLPADAMPVVESVEPDQSTRPS
jgi:NTE family protein